MSRTANDTACNGAVPPMAGSRMRAWLVHGAALALGILLQTAARADDVLPGALTGTWATGASLQEGAGPQNELHLLADGYGAMVGSTSAPVRVDGKDDGKPAPRGIIGFVVKAAWRDGQLTLHPFSRNPEEAARAARIVIVCRPGTDAPTLTCTGPNTAAAPLVLKRRSTMVPNEILRTIDAGR